MKIYYWNKNDNSKLYNLWYTIFHDSKNFCNYYFKEKLLDNRVIVLNKNNDVVSMLHLNPYKLLLLNKEINSEYIVGVATKENFRGNGFLKKLISQSINDLYNEGTEFVFLTTVDENIYSKYNFKYISSCIISEITKTKFKIPFITSPIELDMSLSNEFLSYYNRKMKENYDGYVKRDNYYVERILKEIKCEDGTIQLFYKDGLIKGYIMLYIFKSTIQIREIIYDTDILLDIVSFLQNIVEDNKTINLTYACNQRIEYIFQYYFDYCSNIKPYIMARLVYIKTFLERIRSDIPININIRVIDSIINENNKTFNWYISNTFSCLTQTNKIEDIVIDIGTLTQWICGYISIEELMALKRIDIKNIDIINSLKSILIYNTIFINEIV